ncbi:hypothetical protein [Halobacterium salinarum]|uniref:Uncharacterized protein n=1 Tax=Halobacterium salinarum (strain ATCC 33171 / DSM 3754 / JCM 8978 / NBRC 102687 / NCIMB 764 / 91-R6) TaxID=2597657 RepID=A0A4D6GZ76_HALS9|nr:hypothetical protein [Halobacterium salinarum]MDL0144709.1 hypothetical protein [Halobacterium salinarum]QCC46158.1 uncharacterized protein HBSAL_13235 [Halobacterium salinarum]TYO73827.1 hypothetical protein APQ99_02365 [Halobacterium salinarum DSM 3754]
MSYVSLSDEETKVIFAGEAATDFAALDASEQEEVITRLLNIVTSEAPPSSFIYERIANLDIITVGDQCRLYTKVVDEIPRGDTEYHVIYLFFIDPYHDYPHKALAAYSPSAEAKAEEVTALEQVSDVEQYFADHDALDEDDLRDLLP